MSRQMVSSSGRVFVDTSAHFALADPHDGSHARARTIGQGIIAHRFRLFTTNFVLAETHALILARRGRTAAWRALQEIERGTITIVRVSVADEEQARRILADYDDKDFSLTDATSFAVMERLKIPSAFTFDRNFSQYGLTVLTPDNF